MYNPRGLLRQNEARLTRIRISWREGRAQNRAKGSAKGLAYYLSPKAQRVNFLFQGKCLTLCSFILSFSAESLTNFLVIWNERHVSLNMGCFSPFNTFNTVQSEEEEGGNKRPTLLRTSLQTEKNGNLSRWPVSTTWNQTVISSKEGAHVWFWGWEGTWGRQLTQMNDRGQAQKKTRQLGK